MSAEAMAADALLGMSSLACWVGAVGLVRMRSPYQALHSLGPPAIAGMGTLTAAVFVQTGWCQASWKCAIIFIVLVASNAVGSHAAARAFRDREKGHWEPLPEDPEIEFLRGTPQR